jgi:protein phosphatase
MTLTMRYAARSDRGLIRHGNQDSVYAGPRLLAVADGMGGMAAGDVASNIVIGPWPTWMTMCPGHAPLDALRNAVDAANQQIRDAVEQNPAMEGMGTTLTGMLFGGNKIGMVHIGDSRAYLLRDGEFVQITRDDTYVQLLVDEGRITEVEANTHPQKSLLMRALDGRDADPEYSVRQVVPGDRYLLCSDGLSGVVSDETIAATLREYSDPNQCAERLIQLALRAGGPDNITVIIADFTDADIVEESPIVAGAAANDRGMTSSADSSTPAARASALTQPRDATPDDRGADDAESRPRRHPVRTALVLIILAGLLTGGLWGGWQYTQSKYYVGVTDDGKIAVFQGIPGEIAGFELSTVSYKTTTSIDDLTPAAADKVRSTIGANSREEAMAQLNTLFDPRAHNIVLPCVTITITPSPTADAAASPSPDPSASPQPSASASSPAPEAVVTTSPSPCRPANR